MKKKLAAVHKLGVKVEAKLKAAAATAAANMANEPLNFVWLSCQNKQIRNDLYYAMCENRENDTTQRLTAAPDNKRERDREREREREQWPSAVVLLLLQVVYTVTHFRALLLFSTTRTRTCTRTARIPLFRSSRVPLGAVICGPLLALVPLPLRIKTRIFISPIPNDRYISFSSI